MNVMIIFSGGAEKPWGRLPGAEGALLAAFLELVAAAKYKVPELVIQPGSAPVI